MLPAQRPHLDELAPSAVIRCCRVFNLPMKAIGREVFGQSRLRMSLLGATDMARLSSLFRMSAADLLWNHTLFPYVTATTSAEVFERVLAEALGDGGKWTRMAIIFQNAFGGVPARRYCRHCAEHEQTTLGYSFWHRSHNLPGVLVCRKHNAYLRQTGISPQGDGGPGTMLLPHECSGRKLGARGTPSPIHQRLAELSLELLDRKREAPSPALTVQYRELAEQGGWLHSGARVDTEALAASIRKLFGRRLLEICGAAFEIKRSAWPFLMLRPGVEVQFSPVKHVLMRTLLETDASGSPPALNHAHGPAGSSAGDLDAFYAKVARNELKSVVGQRQVLTTEAFLRRVGCFSHYRRRRLQMPQLSQVVRQFRSSSATIKRLECGKRLFREDVGPQRP